MVEETLLAKSLLKRRQWAEKYNVDQQTLYDLFSEFSAMVMMMKTQKNQQKINGTKRKKKQQLQLTKEVIQESKLSNLLPIKAEAKMSLEYQRLMKGEDMTLGPKELKDFTVTLKIMRTYANALRELGPKL